MSRKRFEDPQQHRLHYSWLRARCQAKYRNEDWHITLEQYLDIWQGLVHLKGRSGDCLVMTRCDTTQPWTIDNIALITRADQMGRRNRQHLQTDQ